MIKSVLIGSIHLLIIDKFWLVTMCQTVQSSMTVYYDSWLTKYTCTGALLMELLSEKYKLGDTCF